MKMTDSINEEKTPLCSNCPYWIKTPDLNDITKQQGECRAMPPQMIATPVQTVQGMGLNIQSMFPITASKAWCSKHPTYELQRRIEETTELQDIFDLSTKADRE